MRILIDARLYGLENAGLGRYTINLIDKLQEIDKETKYSVLLRKKYHDKLKLNKNFKKILADVRHYSIKEQFLIPKLIKKQNPDLVHFPHFNVPLMLKEKFVVTIHDLLMHKFKGKKATTQPFYTYGIKRLGYNFVFKKAVKDSEKIFVPTEFVKDEVAEEYGVNEEKLVVTYEGVDEKLKAKNKKKVLDKHGILGDYFIYVGNAYPHKNLERLMDAIVHLNKVTEDKVSLIIISSRDAFVERLKKDIKDSKAEKYVDVLGFVPDEELGSLISESKAFVYPSLSEGFGLQGLEAMKMGTLLLCSNIPVFKEVYEDNAVYFNPHDFSAISKTMKDTLVMKKSKRKEIIKKAKNFVDKYSWKKMVEDTLEVYKKVADA